MNAPPPRILLHLGRDRCRAVDPDDIYFLEAVGETTLVRTRSARRIRDVRALGELLELLSHLGFVRVHRNHAVSVRHIRDIRRRSGVKDWR